MKRYLSLAGLGSILLLLSPRSAEAHIVGARLGDFYAGALHPLTDLQDLLLWIGLGGLAGFSDPKRGKWLVLLFPLGLLTGSALAFRFDLQPVGLIGDAALTLLIGLLMAAALSLPSLLLFLVAFGVALVRGVVNAAGAAPDTDRVLFAAGLSAAGYVVMTLSMAAAMAFCAADAESGGWRHIALRASGSWIAAIGLMMGGFALMS